MKTGVSRGWCLDCNGLVAERLAYVSTVLAAHVARRTVVAHGEKARERSREDWSA